VGDSATAVDRGLTALCGRLEALFEAGDPQAAGKAREARHVATLRTIFAALARRDFEAAFAHLAPDTRYQLSAGGQIPFQMSGVGRTAVQDGIRTNFGAVAYDRIDIDTLVAQGDVVVIIARQVGRWRESGVAFDERIMLEYVFRDDQVLSYRGWVLPFAP